MSEIYQIKICDLINFLFRKSRRENPENEEDKANLVLETTIEDVSKAMTPKKVRERYAVLSSSRTSIIKEPLLMLENVSFILSNTIREVFFTFSPCPNHS